MRTMRISSSFLALAIILAGVVAFSTTTLRAAEIPKRPEGLKFPALSYEPPDPAKYRVQLKSGPVAYVAPDRQLPLVNIAIYVRVGDYLVPAGKEGLAEITGYLLTHSGTKSMTAEALEERLAFLAAQLNSSINDFQGSVSLNLLSKDLDEGMSILREVLTEPRFQENRIALTREQTLQAMKQRNDDSEAIEGRERDFLAFGDNFWANHYSTAASINSITREDIEEFHKKWFHPDDFVVAVSGDFDRDDMVARLEKLFGDWPFKGEKPGPIPTDTKFVSPGVYIVDKDVNQGRVSIMLPGIMRDNPDYFSVLVMNDILGGGGFTSRIMSSVRSDEGLAYSVYSAMPGGVYYPLTFTAAFQSKSRTVAYASSIVLKEMKKMTDTPVSDKELKISKDGYIDRFPRSFATKSQVANTFAQDEFTGRYASDPGYWKEFRKRIAAVTKEDVERVAKKYLTVDKAVILVVGEKSQIMMKLPDHPVTLAELTSGAVTDLPLRDPMTMKPMPVVQKSAAK